jgi:hypothetical protein
MDELYRSSDGGTPGEDKPDKPGPGAADDTAYDAQLEAILAREDAMPTREESAAASWGGDTPAEPDEPDPASEYDPGTEAAVTREDSMPDREESAASWDSDLPDDADEEDADIEIDARTAAMIAREDSMPDRQESARATWGDTTDDGDHDHGAPDEDPLGDASDSLPPDRGPAQDQPADDSAGTPELAEPRSSHRYAHAEHEDEDEPRGATPDTLSAASARTPAEQDRHDYPDPHRDRLIDQSAHPEHDGYIAGDKPGDSPADLTGIPLARSPDQPGAPTKPQKISIDGKDIEVTHDAADGIWVEGLPGEAPTRIGDVLSSPERGERSRTENLREEVNRDAEKVIDLGGKWTDLFRDAYSTPPPTHSMTYHRSPEMTVTHTEHGINAGHGVEAALALTIVGAAAVHKLHERWQGVRERERKRREADYASD